MKRRVRVQRAPNEPYCYHGKISPSCEDPSIREIGIPGIVRNVEMGDRAGCGVDQSWTAWVAALGVGRCLEHVSVVIPEVTFIQ